MSALSGYLPKGHSQKRKDRSTTKRQSRNDVANEPRKNVFSSSPFRSRMHSRVHENKLSGEARYSRRTLLLASARFSGKKKADSALARLTSSRSRERGDCKCQVKNES